MACFLENQVKQFDQHATTFSQYLGPCLSNPFSYREGVRVNTVGPNVLYSCFMFHTSTNQLWQARIVKPPTETIIHSSG